MARNLRETYTGPTQADAPTVIEGYDFAGAIERTGQRERQITQLAGEKKEERDRAFVQSMSAPDMSAMLDNERMEAVNLHKTFSDKWTAIRRERGGRLSNADKIQLQKDQRELYNYVKDGQTKLQTFNTILKDYQTDQIKGTGYFDPIETSKGIEKFQKGEIKNPWDAFSLNRINALEEFAGSELGELLESAPGDTTFRQYKIGDITYDASEVKTNENILRQALGAAYDNSQRIQLAMDQRGLEGDAAKQQFIDDAVNYYMKRKETRKKVNVDRDKSGVNFGWRAGRRQDGGYAISPGKLTLSQKITTVKQPTKEGEDPVEETRLDDTDLTSYLTVPTSDMFTKTFQYTISSDAYNPRTGEKSTRRGQQVSVSPGDVQMLAVDENGTFLTDDTLKEKSVKAFGGVQYKPFITVKVKHGTGKDRDEEKPFEETLIVPYGEFENKFKTRDKGYNKVDADIKGFKSYMNKLSSEERKKAILDILGSAAEERDARNRSNQTEQPKASDVDLNATYSTTTKDGKVINKSLRQLVSLYKQNPAYKNYTDQQLIKLINKTFQKDASR